VIEGLPVGWTQVAILRSASDSMVAVSEAPPAKVMPFNTH
jgi:hypothetical protein